MAVGGSGGTVGGGDKRVGGKTVGGGGRTVGGGGRTVSGGGMATGSGGGTGAAAVTVPFKLGTSGSGPTGSPCSIIHINVAGMRYSR